MKDRRRTRRMLKWILLGIAVSLAALGLVSIKWWLHYQQSINAQTEWVHTISICSGVIQLAGEDAASYTYRPSILAPGFNYWRNTNEQSGILWSYLFVSGQGFWAIAVPLWWPLVFFAVTALLLFWRERRRRPGPGCCANCGYDLTGNVTGVCPECGCALLHGY